MNKRSLTILQLYPRDMNIYGDWGNTLVLKRRLERYGYDVRLLEYNQGDDFPSEVDIIVGGGGQDSGQDKIQADLLGIGEQLKELAEQGTPMLVICGLYQLFGHSFTTQSGQIIHGIGLLDVTTKAGPERLIGNVTTHSETFGEIVGYENHSGQTFLGEHARVLGSIIKGAGNNGQDDGEGVHYKHVVASYLHGSLLPKNPAIADYLIRQAAIKKYGDFGGQVIDDRLAEKARAVAAKRPR